MSLEHLVVTQTNKNKNKNATLMEYVQGAQGPTERLLKSQSWNNLSKKVNKVVLDYNPKYKINFHESVLNINK